MSALSFGNYAIATNVKHFFEKEPKWFWEIKPPTVTEDLIMSNFMFGGPVTEVEDGLRREDGIPTTLGIAVKEVSLLYAGTNIPRNPVEPVEEGGEPALKSDATLEQVEAFVKKMPTPMLMEIWRKIGEVLPNLRWGPSSKQSGDDKNLGDNADQPEPGKDKPEVDNGAIEEEGTDPK